MNKGGVFISEIISKYIDNTEKFIFKDNFKLYSINTSDIYFFEKYGKKTEIVTKNKRITYYGSFISLEKILNKKHFFKCHRSYIINLKKNFIIDKDEIIFFDIQDIALISKSNKEELISLIENLSFKRENFKCS